MVCGFVCLNVLETGNSDMNALSELSVMQIVHMTLFSFKHKDRAVITSQPLCFFPPLSIFLPFIYFTRFLLSVAGLSVRL